MTRRATLRGAERTSLEVHPDGGGRDLDVWIERSLVRYGYGWSVPAGGEQRVGVGSYEPRDHVRRPTVALAERLAREPVRYQGNWFPHRLRRAAQDGVFFAGDSAGHCFPLSGEGIRTAFYFGIACGRQLRSVLSGERARDEALRRYASFSASHSRAFGLALRLQWLVPRLPPRVLTLALRALARQALVDRVFGWYLDQAHPAFAGADRSAATPPPPIPPYTLPAAGSRDAAAPLGLSDAHRPSYAGVRSHWSAPL